MICNMAHVSLGTLKKGILEHTLVRPVASHVLVRETRTPETMMLGFKK